MMAGVPAASGLNVQVVVKQNPTNEKQLLGRQKSGRHRVSVGIRHNSKGDPHSALKEMNRLDSQRNHQ